MEKVFKSILENNSEDHVWGAFIVVPIEVVEFFNELGVKRFICALNDLVEYNCAFISSKKGKLINVNKEVRKKLHLHSGSIVSVRLKADTSKYGMPVPKQFQELLDTDDEFNNYFNSLTPGKQRNLLYMVIKPKSDVVKAKKALVIANHLVKLNGKLDFKLLNEDFKAYNKLLKGE